MFGIDIVLTFFTSIPDEEKMQDIVDRKVIAKKYLETWFTIDFVSIIPFDFIVGIMVKSEKLSNMNMVLRVSKIGKVYKLIRLMRLVKVFKILKQKKQLTAKFSKSLEINAGQERLIFVITIFVFMVHLFACAWILIG